VARRDRGKLTAVVGITSSLQMTCRGQIGLPPLRSRAVSSSSRDRSGAV
jgi:hypothetical protein